MKKVIIAMAAALLLACSTTPSGYTPEAWANIREHRPAVAKAIEWIIQDPKRAEYREAYINVMGVPTPLADQWCAGLAESEMLYGKKDGFKDAIASELGKKFCATENMEKRAEITRITAAFRKQ